MEGSRRAARAPDSPASPRAAETTLLVFTLGARGEGRRKRLLPAALRDRETALYRACLDEALAAGRGAGCRLEVCSPAGVELPADALAVSQAGSGFGERFAQAFDAALRRSAGPVVAVGTDTPGLAREHVERALTLLRPSPAAGAATRRRAPRHGGDRTEPRRRPLPAGVDPAARRHPPAGPVVPAHDPRPPAATAPPGGARGRPARAAGRPGPAAGPGALGRPPERSPRSGRPTFRDSARRRDRTATAICRPPARPWPSPARSTALRRPLRPVALARPARPPAPVHRGRAPPLALSA